ncbi:hypothetical protein [uncultured Sphaerochaeta sp.]|uniref:hypothetical protein n=1 Tax=uncultured Sphaerochaeta sp. TaxID=886478 RepID=UPI0029CA275C|nr:hypothetical protein [uncultured Sphaerochaeta sp.]
MVDAHLRLKMITTEDIKNLIIGGQTGIDGIRFFLLPRLMVRNSPMLLSLGICSK